MKSHWLIFSEYSPIKQVLYKILFIDSLLVAFAISGAIALGEPVDLHFREEGFLTYVSCLQLLIATAIAGKIFNIARKSQNHQVNKNKIFWLVISLGLLFLVLDEALEIHEEIDFLLHDIFNITQTNLTDLLDDLIVGMYILLFIIYIFSQWKTIQLFKRSFTFFVAGFIFTGIMVILDIASHNSYIASLLTSNPIQEQFFKQWLGALEDAAKIYAEGMFIVGVYKCRQIARLTTDYQ
ncbi:MAG: hypothetical protein ACFCAD_23115 [Pleurocapsa sp.]